MRIKVNIHHLCFLNTSQFFVDVALALVILRILQHLGSDIYTHRQEICIYI